MPYDNGGTMKELIRQFEKESGLEIYGLGARRDRWEHTIEKFTELIVKECANVAADHDALDIYEEIREHFGVEE